MKAIFTESIAMQKLGDAASSRASHYWPSFCPFARLHPRPFSYLMDIAQTMDAVTERQTAEIATLKWLTKRPTEDLAIWNNGPPRNAPHWGLLVGYNKLL